MIDAILCKILLTILEMDSTTIYKLRYQMYNGQNYNNRYNSNNSPNNYHQNNTQPNKNLNYQDQAKSATPRPLRVAQIEFT